MSRIEPLSTLPLFFNLRGKDVLLAGAGYGSLWKAELILATGANLHIYAGSLTALEVFSEIDAHKTALSWYDADFRNKALAILGTEDEEEAAAFYAKAKQNGAIAYVIDKPKFCDVTFGTIINRSPVVIGISTTGAAPILGQAIRAKIEAILPTNLAAWGALAVKFRPLLQRNGHLPAKSFWQSFVAKTFANGALVKFEEVLVEPPKTGKVVLVGAGTGDPDLLTIKALQSLQIADVILYDALVNPAILEKARRESTRICVGKRGYGVSCKQSDINTLILEHAKQGKTVVRLKSGCATIFARSGEEVEACDDVGIPVEIIPGISSAQAAAASLKISLTHRDYAKQVQYITGHGKDGALPKTLNLEALLKGDMTTAVYMPQKTLKLLAAEALKMGADPFLPATAIANISLPTEIKIESTLAELSNELEKAVIKAPVLVLIGKALNARKHLEKPQKNEKVIREEVYG